MDGNQEQDLEDFDGFQKYVAERFSNLLDDSSSSSSCSFSSNHNNQEPSLLSIAFLRKLLDAFLCCESEFKAVLIDSRDPSTVSRSPFDRLLPELLDRSVKALDICNAVTHGVETVRHCQKLAEIAVTALGKGPIGDGQVRRAKKALGSLAAAMAIDDDYSSGGSGSGKGTERAWSFGKRASPASKERGISNFRKDWSAAKQIHSMTANLAPPRESAGASQPVYVMSAVTAFTMWSLAAAIPCQERLGLGSAAGIAAVAAAKHAAWAQPVAAIQEKLAEEWRRKERRGSAGLLEELQRMERSAANLAEFVENFRFPVEASMAAEAAAQVEELRESCRRMEEGLVPLQRQIREVFHKLVKTRTEVLRVLDQGGKMSTPAM